MSELICTLDDYIFALAPLGILTAVVSLIRVRGNSTLRAFIGRAQEDPGASELELLSCVSDTTAEVFTESRVARITGNPKILEVVVNEKGSVAVEKLSDVAGKPSSTDLEKDATLPNLSLNKGIRRRAPFWFYAAAVFGTGLQSGVIIYAALTVLYWPDAFLKDGARVPSYALPMFVIGTILLTLGMFFCALLVENFSEKHFLKVPKESRVYWIQPGNQEVGDQKIPSFVGQTEKGVDFTRSVRHHSPDVSLDASKEAALVAVVVLTMVGFVIQFVGLRGLHSSVILANLGSTMVMTVVRTCLRAQRMNEQDNMLKDERKSVCNGEHELDWLVFHLFKLQSFKICPASTLSTSQRPQSQPNSITEESLLIRHELTKLTGSHWNKTRTRNLAHSLGQATHELMKLVNSWSEKELPYFDILIPLEAEQEGSQQAAVPFCWEKRLLTGASIDVDYWEAMLGLYVWSLRKENPELMQDYRDDFFRAFAPKDKTTHQARLLYQKWTNDKSALHQGQIQSPTFLNGCETFGHFHFSTNSQAASSIDAALVAVSSDIYTLAAQDLYMHVLYSLLERLPGIGAKTQILSSDDSSYKLYNERIETLIQVFVNAGFGNKQEGKACTLPILSSRGLLPEITLDSPDIDQHMCQLEEKGDYGEIVVMCEWLCSFADYGEIETAMLKYGFICLMSLMMQDVEIKELAVERIKEVSNDFHKTSPKAFGDIASLPPEDWRANFRNEISWLALRLVQYLARHNPDQQNHRISQEFEKDIGWVLLMYGTSTEPENASPCERLFFSMWFGSRAGNLPDESDTYKIVLDWLVKYQYEIMLKLLIMRLTQNWNARFNEEHLAKMFSYAVQNNYTQAVSVLSYHTEKTHLRDLIIQELIMNGDIKALEAYLYSNTQTNLTSAQELALLAAAESKQFPILNFLLGKGANVDARDLSGETGLMKSAERNDCESVQLFLSHGANLELQDNRGQTALLFAAANGCLEIAKLLVGHGANVNAAAYNGDTALMKASCKENFALLKYLCDQKADIHAVDADHRSALDKILFGGLDMPWREGCEYLLSLGAKKYAGQQYPEL